jgi:hypothetical protein
MANRLKMAIIQSIQRLRALGWSQRRIARELGIVPGAAAEAREGAWGAQREPGAAAR